MIILGVAISEQFNTLRKSLEESFLKKTKYKPIPAEVHGFGALDYHSSPDYIKVLLSTKLSGNLFEATILHELLHVQQIENDFPEIETYPTDPLKIEIGATLQSTILDLDVMDKMSQLGYSSSFFITERYKILKDLANHSYDMVTSNDYETLVTLQITLMILTFKKKYTDYLVSKLKQVFPHINANLNIITDIIKKTGYTTPVKCYNNYKDILSILNLWKDHCIKYKKVLTTSP